MCKRILFPVLFGVLFAVPAAGQVRVVGRVIDDLTEMPLADAQVRLMAPDGSTLSRTETSETGRFEFEVQRVRAVRITARRLSYTANTTPLLYFDGRKFFQVEVRLDPEAILLAPLEVVAWSQQVESPLLEAYRQRLETGLGVYITREDVESRNPMYVTDLLREVPGVALSGSGSGLRRTVTMARAGASSCATQIFLDGFPLNRRLASAGPPIDFRIDDVVVPSSIEGIEVYRGLSTVPPEFLSADADCGVIAIWTRRGGANR